MRRICCVLLVVVLAGCIGPAGGPAGTPTAGTPTDGTDRSSTPAGSSTPTTTPPPGTTTAAGPTDANTVAYADLSPAEQAAFDAALDGAARFLPESEYVEGEFHDPDASSVFHENDYVTKGGTTYALSFHEGDLYASYGIDAHLASPDDDASVVAHENLSGNVSTEVRRAIENGSHYVPLGKWDSLPAELADTEYVSYEGDTYRLSYVVGDYWAEVLTVDEVA